MKKIKTITASLLAAAMVISGFAVMPTNADATETTAQTVFYDASCPIKEYWGADTKKVPVKEGGYVFGGWFTYAGGDVNADGTTYTALTESTLKATEDLSTLENVCAKFVPAYVLSIKIQIDKDSEAANKAAGTNDKAFLRLLSSVDTNKYNEIGFDLWYDKTIKETESTKVTKVYSKLTNDETGTDGWTPQETFGAAAKYFSVLRVDSIANEKCSSILYVRPYWITKDGTKVEGMAKYVRVMDGYANHKYISIPVNLMTGSAVAAGMLEMTYDSRLEVVDCATGLLLPEMNFYDNNAGIIKLVGNVSEAGEKEPETDIYANIWFKEKTANSIDATEVLNFTLRNLSFCNWTEATVSDVKAWDVQY